MSTHIDKDHIHNHLIFCNVDNVQKRSFESVRNRNKSSWKDVRKLSDKLCREHNKSVLIESELSNKKGKDYCKYTGTEMKESFRQRLMVAIDHEILDSKSFEDFLTKMRSRGIECTYNPDHKITLKFKMQGQKKNVRAGGLGFNYDENGIRRRIDEAILFRTNATSFEHRTGLIDTTTERMQKSPQLKQWAEIRNMQEVSKQLNILTNSKLKNENEGIEISENLSKINRGVDVLSGVIHNLETVKKHKPIVLELQELQSKMFSKKKAQAFEKEHEKELAEYQRADNLLRTVKHEHCVKNGKYLPISELKSQLDELRADREVLDTRRKNLKKELVEINKAYQEVQEYLGRNPELREMLHREDLTKGQDRDVQQGRSERGQLDDRDWDVNR